MNVTCGECKQVFDDAYRWTICPHNWLRKDSTRSIDDERRIGDWIQTYTGRKVYPADPRPEDIDPIDIAHALARICRFGGHVKCEHYSVAQHSYLVSLTCRREHALVGLLHDAAEAYIGDVVRPLKQSLMVYEAIEKQWELILDFKFNLNGRLISKPDDVKYADRRLLATERRDVMTNGPGHERWSVNEPPREEVIVPWSPRKAYEMFLARWFELREGEKFNLFEERFHHHESEG